jgi:hypothetical protein
MKKHLLLIVSIFVIAITFGGTIYPQINKSGKKAKDAIGKQADNGQTATVTLHNGINFLGEFLFVETGDHRLQTQSDFNDIASSITVPTGFVAIIFEEADSGGGYGRSVDLMEDCPDLAKYDFNDKISFISVFKNERSGYIWARGSMRNGQFMPGHWERMPATGIPVNNVAVVSPPIPSHKTEETFIEQKDSQFTLLSIGTQSAQDAASSELAETLMGVIGSDYKGAEEIGSAAFERDSNNALIPDNINFWYPQKAPRDQRNRFFKRTLSGTIPGGEFQPQIAEIEGTYEDHDFNLDILPSPNYMNLISDGHKPELSIPQSLKLQGKSLGLSNPTGSFSNPCTKPFTVVEAEVDARLNAKSALNFLTRQRIGKQIAVYGPWIYDIGHCYQPEIHPAEQVWWSENEGKNRKYNLNIFCDSSKRFWWRSQMDDGTKMKPWGAPPITGTFAIAFEVEIGQGEGGKFELGGFSKPGKKFEVSNIEDFNVVANPNSNKVYNLIYQNNILVSFVPHNDAFKVSFEKVGFKPGTTNIVRGFLVIEATVGTVTQISGKITVEFPASGGVKSPPIQIDVPAGATADTIEEKYEKQLFKKVEGHYMFSILQSELPAKTPMNQKVKTK